MHYILNYSVQVEVWVRRSISTHNLLIIRNHSRITYWTLQSLITIIYNMTDFDSMVLFFLFYFLHA